MATETTKEEVSASVNSPIQSPDQHQRDMADIATKMASGELSMDELQAKVKETPANDTTGKTGTPETGTPSPNEGATKGDTKATPGNPDAVDGDRKSADASAAPTLESVISELTEAYSQQEGKLTDEQYKQLADLGIPKAIADDYISAKSASVAESQAKLLEVVGGEAAFEKITTWALGNLSQEEVAEYNKRLASDNPDDVKFTLRALKTAYEASNGREGVNIGRSESVQSRNTVEVFGSDAEMTAALNDPRYQRGDRAYQELVQRRMVATAEQARRNSGGR